MKKTFQCLFIFYEISIRLVFCLQNSVREKRDIWVCYWLACRKCKLIYILHEEQYMLRFLNEELNLLSFCSEDLAEARESFIFFLLGSVSG